MKKFILAAAAVCCMLTSAKALHVALYYGQSFSTTSTTVSFTYSGTCDNAVDYFSGHIVGTVYLWNGSSLYYGGEFKNFISNCASTTNIVGAPAYAPSSAPGQFYSPSWGCNASQTITMTMPNSCVPTGSYYVYLKIEGYDYGIEFDGTPTPTCNVTVGTTTFPQPIVAGVPYAHVQNQLLGSAVLGLYTVSSGGGYNVSFTTSPATCSSSSGSIGMTISSGTPNYSIWTQPGGSPTVTSSSTPSFSEPAGSYTVTVIDANGCREDAVLSVAPPTPPTITITKSPTEPGSGYCRSTCVTLTATPSTGSGYTYQWKRNGVNVSTSQSFCNVPGPTPTTTTYSVNISNSFGCTATATVNVLTNSGCTAATGACCTNDGHRMMEPGDSSFVTVQVFPNPATDVVNIQFGEPVANGTVLEFTDITGKVVRHVEVPEGATCYTMNVNDLPAGIYLANVFDHEAKIISTEFIVE
jgi:hypothetical protein